MSKSRKGEKQRQHHSSRLPCYKDGAAKGSAENDVAAPGLLSRIRRWRQSVPVDHRKIGLRLRRSCEGKSKRRRRFPGRQPANLTNSRSCRLAVRDWCMAWNPMMPEGVLGAAWRYEICMAEAALRN